ncbi:lipoate protein ligase C-terminal domain-containing protein [Shigella flexneri]
MTSKKADTRTQVYTDSLNPAPLEVLAERLQGCQYRADILQHRLAKRCLRISD